MSILTKVPAIPTSHAGVDIDPKQMVAAINYLSAIHGPTVVKGRWTTDKAPTTRAAFRHKKIVAVTTAEVGLGLEYKNLPEQDGKESGPLRGKDNEWLLYPWIIVAPTGLKLRLYPVKSTMRTTYFVDGEEVADTAEARAEVRAMLYSRKPSDAATLTIDVFAENFELLK